jgi:sulfur transfer protein SufE/stress-induced morphogen
MLFRWTWLVVTVAFNKVGTTTTAFVAHNHQQSWTALCWRSALSNTNNSEITSSSPISSATTAGTTSPTTTTNPHKLTPELLKIANAFAAIGDDKLRYKQLLYMANQLAPLDAAKQTPANKVPGCLSTVYIDARAVGGHDTTDDDDDTTADDVRVYFTGDSDGLLTKGLVALLIRGLSGNTAEDIAQVDAAFVQTAGIAASLTPGRNNGFLNMLSVMKQKAVQVQNDYLLSKRSSSSSSIQRVASLDTSDEANGASSSTDDTGDDDTTDRPMYRAMIQALQPLQPTYLQLTDVSHQHAGHVGAGTAVESHFELNIVSDAFEGLSLVQRHKLVYMMLVSVMPRIHALQIRSKTVAEHNQ